MNNLKKLNNIWFVEEELAYRERDRQLSKRLALLRSEHLESCIKSKKDSTTEVVLKDVSTQTEKIGKNYWKKFLKKAKEAH